MNIYKTKPKNGNAKKAWGYFCTTKGYPPIEMFYSRDHEDGRRWVAYYGSAHHGSGTNQYYSEIESSSLNNWCDGKFN